MNPSIKKPATWKAFGICVSVLGDTTRMVNLVALDKDKPLSDAKLINPNATGKYIKSYSIRGPIKRKGCK